MNDADGSAADAIAPTPARQRLLRFATVGVGASLTLFVLSFVFRNLGMPAFLASTLAYAIAFAGAYSAQHRWTFGGVHGHGRAFPRYVASQIGCGLAAGLVAHLAVEEFGQSPFWMSVLLTVAAGATSYMLSTFWVFPHRRDALMRRNLSI